MAPLGKPFSYEPAEGKVAVTAGHYRELLVILRAVHEAGWVHRDVRIVNFFLDPESDKVSAARAPLMRAMTD